MSSWFRFIDMFSRPRRPTLRRRHGASPSQGWSAANISHAVEQLETRRLLAATTVSGAWLGGVFDQVGLYEDGIWQLDLDGDFVVGDDSPPFRFGRTGDLPVTGDWNGDGVHSVGVYRDGLFILDFNDDRFYTPRVDIVRAFGAAGDVPIIGNWDGVGGDDLGIVRNAHWALDTNGNLRWDGGGRGDTTFVYGLANDIPVAGNWSPANLRDGIGIYRNGTWAVDRNENFRHDPGIDAVFRFGVNTSQPFTGDFAGDNMDEVGIVTAGGTPFVRAIPPLPSQRVAAAAPSPAVQDATDRQQARAATTTDDTDDDSSSRIGRDQEDEIEALFTGEKWRVLERFTLTGAFVS